LWCFIVRIIDFIREFWKILEFLLKKRYFKYKTFSEFHRLLFAFLIFSIFENSFSILPVYSFQKNCKIFVLFYCMDPRFYQKIKIFEIQNFDKIPSFTILFYFSSIFGIFFCISSIQTCPKIMDFFVVFYWKG